MKTKVIIAILSISPIVAILIVLMFSYSKTRQYDDEHFELILRNVYLRGYTEGQQGNDLDAEWKVIKNEYDLNYEN